MKRFLSYAEDVLACTAKIKLMLLLFLCCYNVVFVGDVADVSGVHAATIFWVEMCGFVQF
jgi:hypothetical protein